MAEERRMTEFSKRTAFSQSFHGLKSEYPFSVVKLSVLPDRQPELPDELPALFFTRFE